jgi:hypothetical protein
MKTRVRHALAFFVLAVVTDSQNPKSRPCLVAQAFVIEP